MAKNLLLVSNSTLYEGGYLDHCESQIREVLRDRERVLFIPYARSCGRTLDEYTKIAHDRFNKMGFELQGIHEYSSSTKAVRDAEAIFIGGGNTFVLLKSLYDSGIIDEIQDKVHDSAPYIGISAGSNVAGRTRIIDEIQDKVHDGTPYIGISAGSNVAGRTIMTTNDMPIAYPPSFDAIGLVPFIINPHYLDPDPNSTHMGETRETRIKEYHVFNDNIVVGLREGAMLHVIGDKVYLKGSAGARIFRKGLEPTEHQPGESLDFLLK